MSIDCTCKDSVKIRKSNFELLRIVAMLMIVAFHFSVFVGQHAIELC